jgi:hypothetical protein
LCWRVASACEATRNRGEAGWGVVTEVVEGTDDRPLSAKYKRFKLE